MIQFESITTDSFEYASFEIPPGTLCKIIMHSGYDKKIFLDTLLGLRKPAGGRAFLFGKNVYSISEQESFKIFRRLGMVRQDGGLISNLKIWENIALPAWYHQGKRPEELEGKAVALLSALGMDERGCADYMGKTPGELPAHEKRLAGMVRESLAEPELMIYDSLFEEIAPETAGALKALTLEFHSRRPGRSSVFISPDEQSIEHIKAGMILRQEGRELKLWRS